MKSHLTPFCILVALVFSSASPHSAFSQESPDAATADEAVQKYAWETCKAALEAKGEHLNLEYFIPPPVPDDKNFALTPLIKPLLDYTTTKDPKTGGYVIRDPNPPVKAITVKIADTNAPYLNSQGWMTGHARQLELWQAYYRASLPAVRLTKSPAEDVLTVFGKFDGMFAELRQDLQTHPLCRYPLHWELMAAIAMPHLSALQNMVTVLSLRASAELALNRPDAAYADLCLGYQLVGTVRDEPTLIDGLVRITALNILLQPVWEGIASHRWNAEQLAAMEKELRSWKFLSDFNRCIRLERGFSNGLCENTRNDPNWFVDYSKKEGLTAMDLKLTKPAYIYRNQILINTLDQEKFLTFMDVQGQTVNVTRVKDTQREIASLPADPRTYLVKITVPIYTTIATKFAQAQTYANEAAIACEIERYRLAHGSLPATLDVLQMPGGLPHDIINGQPLHYSVTGDDYLLYSIGWNETDDGGKVVFKKDSTSPDPEQGDWVWSLKPL